MSITAQIPDHVVLVPHHPAADPANWLREVGITEPVAEPLVGITECSPDSITEIPQVLSGAAGLW
jgi:hypothetical protein